jgi:hypothetical protein
VSKSLWQLGRRRGGLLCRFNKMRRFNGKQTEGARLKRTHTNRWTTRRGGHFGGSVCRVTDGRKKYSGELSKVVCVMSLIAVRPVLPRRRDRVGMNHTMDPLIFYSGEAAFSHKPNQKVTPIPQNAHIWWSNHDSRMAWCMKSQAHDRESMRRNRQTF